MSEYLDTLVSGFWDYQQKVFPNWKIFFDQPEKSNKRPAVFLKNRADYNVLMKPGISPEKRRIILNQLPPRSRHKWFGSMKSSQALAQSVFANLKEYEKLHYLEEISCDHGDPLFENGSITRDNFFMEYDINFLKEPRHTNLDCFISGEYKIAVECKLTESEFGNCSRIRLKEKDPNYDTDYCNGSYTFQRDRKERCSLTEIGVLYWRYIPEVFKLNSDVNHNVCPIKKNYQLVRNILAVCGRTNGKVDQEMGHAIVIYDARNPKFQQNGEAYSVFEDTRKLLRNPKKLRKCSWQKLIDHIRQKGAMEWLTEQLFIKYGI